MFHSWEIWGSDCFISFSYKLLKLWATLTEGRPILIVISSCELWLWTADSSSNALQFTDFSDYSSFTKCNSTVYNSPLLPTLSLFYKSLCVLVFMFSSTILSYWGVTYSFCLADTRRKGPVALIAPSLSGASNIVCSFTLLRRLLLTFKMLGVFDFLTS